MSERDPEGYGKPDLHKRHMERWRAEEDIRLGLKPATNGKPSTDLLCVADDCPSPPFVRNFPSPEHESLPQQHAMSAKGPMHFGCYFRHIRRAQGQV